MNGKSLPDNRNNTVSLNNMLNYGKQTVKFVLSIIFSGFVLYLILTEFNDISQNTVNYFNFLVCRTISSVLRTKLMMKAIVIASKVIEIV